MVWLTWNRSGLHAQDMWTSAAKAETERVPRAPGAPGTRGRRIGRRDEPRSGVQPDGSRRYLRLSGDPQVVDTIDGALKTYPYTPLVTPPEPARQGMPGDSQNPGRKDVDRSNRPWPPDSGTPRRNDVSTWMCGRTRTHGAGAARPSPVLRQRNEHPEAKRQKSPHSLRSVTTGYPSAISQQPAGE